MGCGVPEESVVEIANRTLSVPRMARGTGSTGSPRWSRGVVTRTATVSGASNVASLMSNVRPGRRPRTVKVAPVPTYITLSGAVAMLVSVVRRWTQAEMASDAYAYQEYDSWCAPIVSESAPDPAPLPALLRVGPVSPGERRAPACAR